jgi:hypothetical protein
MMNYIPNLESPPAAACAQAAAPVEPSIRGPFPARVKGLDARGERFKFTTALENLSAGYCEVRLEGVPEPGRHISVAARVHHAVVVLRGTVLEVLSRACGGRSVSVRITRYRLVSPHIEAN